jgi:hypothetical protein
MVKTMKRFAIIENEIVINIAVAETAIADNWIELPDHAGIGSSYIDGVFSNFPDITIPELVEPEPTKDQLLAQIQALMDKVNALPN